MAEVRTRSFARKEGAGDAFAGIERTEHPALRPGGFLYGLMHQAAGESFSTTILNARLTIWSGEWCRKPGRRGQLHANGVVLPGAQQSIWNVLRMMSNVKCAAS